MCDPLPFFRLSLFTKFTQKGHFQYGGQCSPSAGGMSSIGKKRINTRGTVYDRAKIAQILVDWALFSHSWLLEFYLRWKINVIIPLFHLRRIQRRANRAAPILPYFRAGFRNRPVVSRGFWCRRQSELHVFRGAVPPASLRPRARSARCSHRQNRSGPKRVLA